ncbi:M23 family metallopeptidase [Sphingomonas guangdongensis]|nr:M23 family metallopeptidase [Sphingomonas guangdongensis]
MRIAVALLLVLPTAVPANEAPRVSSGFGARSDPFHGRRAVHQGLDLPGRAGAPVLAAAPGVVRFAGRRGGYGNLVELAHPDGSATRYAHLSAIEVRPGDSVAQGQVIARIGSTGRSTGNHLHFEYRLAGAAVDPTPYFQAGSTMTFARRRAPDMLEQPHRSQFAALRDAAEANAGLPSGIDVARARP